MEFKGLFKIGYAVRRVVRKVCALFVRLLHERTILVLTIMFCGGVATTVWHFSRLSSRLIESAALQGTSVQSETLEELRTIYTSEVVERVRSQGIEVTHDYRTKEGAIPLPVTFSMELGKRIGERGSGIQVWLYSDYPFSWRKGGGPRDDFEREALRELRRDPDRPFFRFEDFEGRPSLRYATADRMRVNCVACHNSHPESPKTDWKVGDVRGVLEIIRPLDDVVAQTRAGLKETFSLLAIMGVLGLSALALVIGRLRRTSAELAKRVAEHSAAEARLATLHEINLAAISTLDLRGVLNVLMEKIDVLLPYTAVMVWLVNYDNGLLERVACWNLDEVEWKRRKLKVTPSLVQAAIDNKTPVVAANVQTDPRTLDPEFYRRNGLVSYLGVPLLVKDEVLGVLVFLTREEHQFTDEEIQFLSTLASQASIAIHNSQLYEQVRQRTHALSALYTIASTANETLNLDVVLQAVIKQITEIFHFDATRIFLLNPDSGELELKDYFEARPGIFGLRRVFRIGVGINGRVAESGEAMIFENVQSDPRYHELSETRATHKGNFSFLAVFPIKTRQRVVGTIGCIGEKPRSLTRDEIRLIMSMTDPVGVAIENATLFERTKNQALELEQANKDLKRQEEIQKLLKELSQDITSLDMDSLLKKLTKKVTEIFQVDVSDIRVVEDGMWRVIGVSGIESHLLSPPGSEMIRGLSQWALEHRRPLMIQDITRTDLTTGTTLKSLGFHGYLGVPLFSRAGEVIGVLRALTYQPKAFGAEEVDLLQQMANGAAIALENARLLEQTKKQATELEQASKMQADFTAMIIHDLRSPIMNMMGTAELMADSVFGPVNEEQKKWLLKVLANGHSLVDLVSDYLDLSKVEAGRIEITKEEVDLRQLIQNSIENYLPLVRDRKISIARNVHPAFSTIKADPRRLNQVLSNLLSNAVKFTGDGGQIEVGADHMNGTEIRIWVTDNGVGIASEEIGSLFEKYRQLTSGKISEHKGTGLGLVVCKKIVEAHGGKIWLESEEGKGSTFYFSLPRNFQGDLPATQA